ncbi:minor capsid protein [Lachnoanaerobaculum saburreum]|uniref:Phage protein F-like protein n=1 Tax=Lachnoanaerobaculum saburreum TaxID=467210 RepID=A0A133ZGG0_9FIRM|nr:minor capsid protein [Lachnoanaerobaculum saburreum]KXB54491.1 phage protein F-like protein [Lachnoanaerobaculum saburreum]
MKNSDYWINRFGQLESVTNKDAMEAYRDVEEIYQKAQTELEDKINNWYQRFATNNQISMAEARKLLTTGEMKELKWSVEEYIKHGKENSISGQWAKELENASARFHVSRLEALKLQTQQSIEALYGNQLDIVDSAMRKAYSQRYYRTAFEFQKGFGVGFAVDRLDENTLSNIINKPWAVDGYNFSKRIWTNKEKLIGELHSSLTRNIITGADPAKAIKEIKSKMGVSSNAAGRLIMTESAYFGSVAQKDMLNNLDVEKYEIVATLDSKTSEICRSLDGKVFDMKDYQAGVTAPPFHPYCRTTTAPYFDDWEELGIDRERVARNDKSKNYFVDGNMTYKEWEAKIKKSNNQEHGGNSLDKPVAVKLGHYSAEMTIEQHKFSKGARNDYNLDDAVVYELEDGVKFVFPKDYDRNFQSMTPDKAVDLWYKVPEVVRKQAQKTIEFVDYYNPQDYYWQKIYKDFSHSYATGGETITFYRYEQPHDDLYVIRTYCHEAGHFIDTNRGVNGLDYSQGSDWTKAMKSDILHSNRISPTTYGENSNAEDFAESIVEFLWDPIYFEENFPNRAVLLKTILR